MENFIWVIFSFNAREVYKIISELYVIVKVPFLHK